MEGNDNNSSSTVEPPLYHEESAPPFLPALALVPFLLPAFWRYEVTVNKTDASFGFSWLKKKFDVDQVREVEPVENIRGLREWGGWGLRKNLRWETGFIARNGPGARVVLEKKNGGSGEVYVFNCEDPATVCSLLKPSD